MTKIGTLIGLVFVVAIICLLQVAQQYRLSREYRYNGNQVNYYDEELSEMAKRRKNKSNQKNIVDARHYIYREGFWDGAPIVVEKHRLIFFTIPKVGSTVFKQLFRRMMGYDNWIKISSALPHNPRLNGLTYLWDYTVEEASQMLGDDEFWTKAIFVRDPKERILSAYLDKGLTNNGNYIRNHCCQGVKTCHIPTTFQEFLTKTVEVCPDPHWMPQTYRMEARYWPYINFVGHMDTVANDTKHLLTQLGLWKRYGQSGWGENGNESIFESTSRVRHKTQSTDRLTEFYTSETETLVDKIYRSDYANNLFRFEKDQLMSSGPEKYDEATKYHQEDTLDTSFQLKDDLTEQTIVLAKKFGVEINRYSLKTPRYGAIQKKDPKMNVPVNSMNRKHYIYQYGRWDGPPVVVSEFKLLFFTIPKVGCTVFKQLFRRMKGFEDWKKHETGGNIPHNPKVNGLKYLNEFSEKDALHMMTSREWTRAIFVREPKDRILSAYLDKGIRKDSNYIKVHCCPGKGMCVERAQRSFMGFLEVISQCSDPHWLPQTYRMMGRYWQYINFVGYIETAEADTRRLLEEIGAWKYGRSGWGENGDEPIFATKGTVKHSTAARDHLSEHYNRETEAAVRQLYSMDFNNPMFNFKDDLL